MLTALRLLRSYCSEEQLQTPALQFFNENLPNLSVIRNAENGQFEVQWKHEDGNISIHNADGRDIHTSLLHRMSIAYANCPGVSSFGGFELSTEAGSFNFFEIHGNIFIHNSRNFDFSQVLSEISCFVGGSKNKPSTG